MYCVDSNLCYCGCMEDETKPKNGSILFQRTGNSIFILVYELNKWKSIGRSTSHLRLRGTSIGDAFHLTPDFSPARVFDKQQGHALLRKYFPALTGREVYIHNPLKGYVLQGIV